MALYNNWVITKKYADTEAAAISTSNKIEFVRFISSDDKFAQSDLESFDDLALSTIKVKNNFLVSSVKISGSTVTVTGVLNNTGNKVDYDINTLLLVCRYNGSEFLAAATTAQSPFLLPAENASEVTEYTIRPQLTLSNSDTVSTVVDPVSAATNERVDDEVKNLQEQIDKANTDRKSIWDKLADLVDKTSNQTISGIKTFSSTIVGSITGNSGTATKLKTARKINGTAFDGTQDIDVKASNDSDIVHKSSNETIDGVKTFKRAINVYSEGGSGLQAYFRAHLMGNDGVEKQTQYLFWQNANLINQDANGFTIAFGSGANTIVGGGESARSLLTAMESSETSPGGIGTNGGSEHAIVVADTNVYIGAGYQLGGDTGKWWMFSNDGKLYMPDGTELSNKYPLYREITKTTLTASQDATAKADINGYVYQYSDTYAEVHFNFGVTLGKVQSGQLAFPVADILPELSLSNINQPFIIPYLDKTKIHNHGRLDLRSTDKTIQINLDLSQLPTNDKKTMGFYNVVAPLYKEQIN